MITIVNRAHFTVGISPEVLRNFPETKVCFLLAKIAVTPKPAGEAKAYLEDLKARVIDQAVSKEISSQNYTDRAVCQSWKQVFGTFNIGDDKKSTIELNLGRLAKECDKVNGALIANQKRPKPEFKRISNFVDFYNLISMKTETPMGALDLSTIQGDITLRYGKEGEIFSPLGKTDEVIDVKPEHVVYADEDSILTWLWNYRDGKHCCVPDDTKGQEAHILLFADQAHKGAGDAEEAILEAEREISRIGGSCLLVETLSATRPQGIYDLSGLAQEDVTLLNPT